MLEGSAGSGVYWRYENWIRRQEARFRSVVGMTGPIAALRKTDLDLLPSDLGRGTDGETHRVGQGWRGACHMVERPKHQAMRS